MNKAVYIFNPWHDLALANDDPNYNAPRSALQFEYDCCEIPLWYAKPESFVFCYKDSRQWLNEMKGNFPQLMTTELIHCGEIQSINIIRPWGWDKLLKNNLSNSGILSEYLLQEHELLKIRKLSNRNLAVEGINYLRENIADSNDLAASPSILTSVDNITDFEKKYGSILFKAPWSGSGKGLRWVRSGLSASHLGWCKNTLLAQGSLIAEKIYDKTLDFALEFECNNGKTEFAGLSLFTTENGIYRNNFLVSDDKIQEIIEANGIKIEFLNRVQNHLIDFFNLNFSPYYSGPLGVDMFIYIENNKTKLHPCVEINLRMTMGYLARIFYDRFVCANNEGMLHVDHFPSKGDLLKDHIRRKNDSPLKTDNGRIIQGYISLNSIDANTCYRLRVEVG